MKTTSRILGGAAIAIGIALCVSPASARVVCNRYGDCWHTDADYRYDRDLRAEAHPDDWYFHRRWDEDREHHWREYHEGRGYWKDGVWITF